jgi:hypothetical protein
MSQVPILFLDEFPESAGFCHQGTEDLFLRPVQHPTSAG